MSIALDVSMLCLVYAFMVVPSHCIYEEQTELGSDPYLYVLSYLNHLVPLHIDSVLVLPVHSHVTFIRYC